MQFLLKSQQNFFVDIDKPILKFLWKVKGLRIGKIILKKKNKGVTLFGVKGYYIATVIETKWYWQREIQSNGQNRELRYRPI